MVSTAMHRLADEAAVLVVQGLRRFPMPLEALESGEAYIIDEQGHEVEAGTKSAFKQLRRPATKPKRVGNGVDRQENGHLRFEVLRSGDAYNEQILLGIPGGHVVSGLRWALSCQ